MVAHLHAYDYCLSIYIYKRFDLTTYLCFLPLFLG